MFAPSTLISLAEVVKLALPTQTEILAGSEYLHHPISWVQAMRAQPPAFSHLEGGELVLIDTEVLSHSYADLRLERVLTDLSKVGVGAVAVRGHVSAAALERARALDLPLFAWHADGPSTREVEREVMRCILDRELQLERYGTRIAEALAHVTIRGEGLPALVTCLAEITGRVACVQNAQGEILAHASAATFSLSSDLLQRLQTDTQAFSAEFRRQTSTPHTGPILRPLPDTDVWRWLMVILTGHQPTGYLSLIGPASTLDEADRVAVERGATACGLELARQRASQVSLREAQRAFFEAVRKQDVEPSTLAAQARKLGYDIYGRQAAFCIAPREEAAAAVLERCAQVIEEALRTRRTAAIVVPTQACIYVCINLPAGRPARRGRRLAAALLTTLQGQMHDVPMIVGVGRSADGIEGLRNAITEAEQARHLGQVLANHPALLYYGDLGIYRLLLPLQGSEVLQRFYEETLAPLVTYDRDHGTELVATLAAYFQQRGNVTRTAEVLYLHRNTLLYRLERIKTILGIDLEDQELLLQLQVALKVHQILP